MSKEDIENRLKELLGIKKAVWFPNGVYGDDDTSGHVGNMFQFTQPGTVVLHYLWYTRPLRRKMSVGAKISLDQQTSFSKNNIWEFLWSIWVGCQQLWVIIMSKNIGKGGIESAHI
jgi:agmatine/peptidylarginine deiminase